MNLEPGPGESLDRLVGDLHLLQRARGHRSATDDVLAAWIASRECPDALRVLDLGCGHGTVTLLLSELLPQAQFVSVEVQPVSADLARRNIRLNRLEARVDLVEGDLRALDLPMRFDLVTGTPPFIPPGSGVLPRDPQRAAARFELRGGIEDYLVAARRHLAPGGVVSLLMDAYQDDRCVAAFDEAGLALHSVTLALPRVGQPPRFRGYVGGVEEGGPTRHSTLTVREADGSYTAEMLELRRQIGFEA
ncbi:MAG: methyltransferase domain-containing protein [Myxococcota bacterium]|nr:methyltransferase domain-containing protein [Myxococcota bacterium]